MWTVGHCEKTVVSRLLGFGLLDEAAEILELTQSEWKRKYRGHSVKCAAC